MTVYTIHEKYHGLIGVCAIDPSAMVDFLIDTDWINEKYKIFVRKFNQLVSLRSYFGENWADRLREMTVDEIEEVFKDNFYFEKYDVYGVE